MAMSPLLVEDLAKEEVSEFQSKLLTDCKTLVKMSRDKMSEYYDVWDANDERYRATLNKDRDDRLAEERKEPVKMCIPLTYSQVQTFVAFIFSLYHQRRYIFELTGNNVGGHSAAKVAEAVLERDLNYNCYSVILYQFLLDLARFSIGVIKHSWVKETEEVWKKSQTAGVNILGFQAVKPKETLEKVTGTKFMGNKLMSISPYRFFPDVRMPLTRFQEGEFCASEDEYTYTTLKQLEKEGVVKGVDFIPKMSKEDLEDRGTSRFINVSPSESDSDMASGHASSIIVTEVQIKLIPKKYLVDGKPVGPEDYPVQYVIWYANDQRMIRCEPAGYIHGKFTYDLAQFSPDQHKLMNECLCDMVAYLQDVINWFINSHIASVRKTITNQFVVDPTAIFMEDFKNRKPIIRLKPNAARSGVDKWIKQLVVQDVTGRHIEDAQDLHMLMQFTTGINENMLGQFHSGRRSATEARNTSVASANRLVLIAKLVFDAAIEPMGRKMLSNHRDGLTEEIFVKLLGDIPEGLEAFNGFVPVDRSKLIGEFDFEVFDGTLAGEKSNLANTLQEIIIAMIQNPEAIPVIGLDLRKMFREMVSLRGIKNLERFDILPNPQLIGGQNATPGTAVPAGTPAGGLPNSGQGIPVQGAPAGASISNLITGG